MLWRKSLDGYLARPNGEADWIVMDPAIDLMAMMARFDTVLMGRRTFEAVQAQSGGGPMSGAATVVVSRTLRQEDHPDLPYRMNGLSFTAEQDSKVVQGLEAEIRSIWNSDNIVSVVAKETALQLAA